jgi:hypothetical protein
MSSVKLSNGQLSGLRALLYCDLIGRNGNVVHRWPDNDGPSSTDFVGEHRCRETACDAVVCRRE